MTGEELIKKIQELGTEKEVYFLAQDGVREWEEDINYVFVKENKIYLYDVFKYD